MEKRVLTVSELRASKSGKQMKVSGYAARYGVLSYKIQAGGNSFRERIAKRAFDGVLATNPDTVCTFNHDANKVLGRTTSGTLQLRGDDKGLAFTCDLPNTSYAYDIHESVVRGDLKDMSFAFELGERDDSWDLEDEEAEDEKDLRGRKTRAKVAIRTIKNFRRLHDVSIVTSPAYPGTAVDARNIVPAEVRSYLEQLTKPKVFVPRPGDICFEDRIVIRDRRRRMDNLLDEI
jgi:HK97 family phage prohead protease